MGALVSLPLIAFQRKALGFVPTGPEQEAILACRKRKIIVTGGEQSGKSMVGSEYLIERLPESEGPALYWLVGNHYGDTRREFEYLAEGFGKLGVIGKKPTVRVDPGEIELKDGTRIETKSADDVRSLMMEAPDGIVGCEASQLTLTAYERMNGRIAPKRGWLFLSGTYELGSLGWFPALAAAWRYGSEEGQSFKLPSWTNHHLYPGGRSDPEIARLERESSDSFFLERIAGEQVPPKGRVLPEVRPDVHVREVLYDPDLPIYIWEDPGYGHAHAIEVAQIQQGGQVTVIDEIYERGVITEDLIEVCQSRPWWKNSGKKLVIDPNYKSQHASSHSIEEIWLEKTGLAAFGTKVRVTEGIERFRSFLKVNAVTGEPKLVVSPHCTGLLSELGLCLDPFDGQMRVWSWKTRRDGGIIGDEPDDRWNDGCKAVIYGLVEEYGLVNSSSSSKIGMYRHVGSAARRSGSSLGGRQR